MHGFVRRPVLSDRVSRGIFDRIGLALLRIHSVDKD
jgi:hypothetical protein